MANVARQALCKPGTLWATYALTRYCVERNVPGDLVECGVYAGAHPAVMARALIDAGAEGRRVHLFDCFSGIPASGPEDLEEGKKIAGKARCQLHQVRDNMTRWGIPDGMLVYHVGLFEDVIPVCQDPKKIALLRLDGDLYRSTKVCLEHLYPRLSNSGWCIVDDLNLPGCRRAVYEYLGDGALMAPVYWQKGMK